jgi:hypothetical protein
MKKLTGFRQSRAAVERISTHDVLITPSFQLSEMSTSTQSAISCSVGDVANIISVLQNSTPEQAADILCVLDKGMDIWRARQEAAGLPVPPPAKAKKEKEKEKAKAPSAPKKEKQEKQEKPALPEGDGASGPDPSEYRVDASTIDVSVCIGRITKGGEDKRWKPIIYRESQCGGSLKGREGSDLCAKCSKREEKYNADPKPCDWTGRVTEEPLDWVHMLGTTWAEEKNPKFLGGGGSVAPSAAASDAGSVVEEEAVVAPVAKKADKAAEKAVKLAATAAAKEAAAAAKAAEKEAAAAAKAAAKEAAAAAKKAEKAAAAAAKKADTPAAAKKPVTKKSAKVAPVAEPVVAAGDLTLIDGTMYMVKNGNVYEYDELTEKPGDFVGRLTGDETIDTEAEEQNTAESDTE